MKRSIVNSRLLWALATFTIMVAGVKAQSGSSIDIEKISSAKNVSNLSVLLTAEQLPTDDVVDPNIYRLGPGDVLAYQLTGPDMTEKITSVTPENSVLLERVGLIDCRGLTMAALRDTVMARIAKRGTSLEIYITLRRARLVYVSVRGDVPYPGTYAVPASMRIGTLLAVTREPWLLQKSVDANNGPLSGRRPAFTTQETRTTGRELSAFAKRNIVVRHRTGSSRVDLVRAGLPDGSPWNPHITEGDEVYVPFGDGSGPTCAIVGAVIEPTTISLRDGDRVSTALAACGGFTSDADLSNVYILSGSTKTPIRVDSSLRVQGDDPLLVAGSSIVVERKIIAGSTTPLGVVEVSGEVRVPGAITIEKNSTRLTDVIAKAGGITEDASLALAYIVRKENLPVNNRDVRDEAMRRFLYSDLTIDDTLRFQLDQQYRIPYVSSDFRKAFADPSSYDNVVLQPGDLVIVPRRPDRVMVYGQVEQPGYVAFEPGKNLDWYLERAGGPAKGAKTGRARIIKGKNRVWVDDDDHIVEAGDEVYVPRAPDVSAGTEIQNYAVIAGIVSSVTALIGLFYTILRR